MQLYEVQATVSGDKPDEKFEGNDIITVTNRLQSLNTDHTRECVRRRGTGNNFFMRSARVRLLI